MSPLHIVWCWVHTGMFLSLAYSSNIDANVTTAHILTYTRMFVYFLWITASAYTAKAPSIRSRNKPSQNCRPVYDFRQNVWVLLLPYSGPGPNVNNCTTHIFNRICFYINKRATNWRNKEAYYRYFRNFCGMRKTNEVHTLHPSLPL